MSDQSFLPYTHDDDALIAQTARVLHDAEQAYNYGQITKEEFEELANDVIQTNLIDKITDSIDYKHKAHQAVQAFIQIVQLILAR